MIDDQVTTQHSIGTAVAIARMRPSNLLQALHKQGVPGRPRLKVEAEHAFERLQ